LLHDATPGVAEENLQARRRGTVLKTVSNARGPLVTATGNRSEALVGYATLSGDMCGVVAPLAGCYKSGPGGVHDLARLVNDRAGSDVIPEHVHVDSPSAELAPGQRDDDTLPPYEVLDPVLIALADERRSVDETAPVLDIDRADERLQARTSRSGPVRHVIPCHALSPAGPLRAPR
jgi:NAD+ synthetase